MRFFNTAGPVKPEIHYCLGPLTRWNLEEVLGLIHEQKYFVLHAPRQTGKTSCLLTLRDFLNDSGTFSAVYANIEGAQAAREQVDAGIAAVVHRIGSEAERTLGQPEVLSLADSLIRHVPTGDLLTDFLKRLSEMSSLPVVLLLDEVDALVGDTLISLLRQIRAGYRNRPAGFPQTVVFCGVRDVRNYRIHSSSEKAIIAGGSAFNIKAESLRLGDFSREEVAALYQQHTEQTGQLFEPDALDTAWELTCGQPWLVNALGYEVTQKMRENRDRSRPIAGEMMARAAENLVLHRETHLDQLTDKLQEPRVWKVMEPIVASGGLGPDVREEDLQYVVDLGLIRLTDSGPAIANGIYREVVPRQLTTMAQISLQSLVSRSWFVAPDGRLQMDKLMASFQEFFVENSESWSQRFLYQEAWRHLLLQAYLQRVVNGGGQVHREYGLGLRRVDLLVLWPVGSDAIRAGTLVQKAVIEIKVVGVPDRKQSTETILTRAKQQTLWYMDRSGVEEGHVVLIDLDPDRSWQEKLFTREEIQGDKRLVLWGM